MSNNGTREHDDDNGGVVAIQTVNRDNEVTQANIPLNAFATLDCWTFVPIYIRNIYVSNASEANISVVVVVVASFHCDKNKGDNNIQYYFSVRR